jgi:ethanolaminephosphotransferase
MDGKQARRTGTSSPLGQLFDHGVDCLGNIAHISSASAYVMMGGTPWYFITQVSLQFSFFLAQWEEYYTHVLPHANGKWIGVTEVSTHTHTYPWTPFFKNCLTHILPHTATNPSVYY